MPRLKLFLPERFVFSTEVEVRVRDLNYGNHLGNDALLGLLHEARVRFLRAHGLSELDVGGAGIIMSDAQIVYRAEANGGDVLRIDIGLGPIGRAECDVLYRVTRLSDGRCIAEAKTNVVFFDYARRRVVGVPEAFRAKFGSLAARN
jgi:4-hydroxybenzoyl-CoA thioesterase